jgi:hypothetical protein
VRNTFPELETTVLNSLKTWLPEKLPDGTPFLKIRYSSPMKAAVVLPLADGTRADIEFILLALDSADAVPKLRSLELTTCLLSEAGELDEAVYDMACTRVGRFPAPSEDGVTPGPKYHGVLIESNPPNRSHWIYRLGVVERPKNWDFFRQPPAMFPIKQKSIVEGVEVEQVRYIANTGQREGIPPSENLKFLPNDYYENLVQGKAHDWIRVYVCGEFGHVMTGRPVYPEWKSEVHIAREALKPSPGLPVIVGLDFGLDHAAVLGQVATDGRLILLDELVTDNCGSRRFAREHLGPLLATERYRGCSFVFIGDPAGTQRGQSDERSCIDVLTEEGFRVHEAPTNNFIARREAVAAFLSMMAGGRAGFIVDPSCTTIIEGFEGGYSYKKMKATDGARYSPAPEKNKYSHPHDALQYLCLYARRGHGGLLEDPFTGRSSVAPRSARASSRKIRRRKWQY